MCFYNNFDYDSENNSDVKEYIIGQNDLFKSINNVDDNSLKDFFSQKSSGDLLKAQKIGVALADYILYLDNYKIHNSQNMIINNKNIELFNSNKRILLWHATNSVLESMIQNEYALSTAQSVLIKNLKLKNMNFYNNVNNSIATSFFILCKRSKNNISCYGDYFATLCKKENNNTISKIGIILYIIYINLIKRKFKNINIKD